jgi:hypothetical protein
MPPKVHRHLPLSLPRRFMGDLLHFAQKVPAARVQRRMQLAAVVTARQAAAPRPSWCVLFIKAFSFVAVARPEVRRAYMPLPWPHLYEHGDTIATVAVERRLKDEDAVFFAHLSRPNEKGLLELEAQLRHCKEEPLKEIGLFRRILRVSRLPRPLRRLLWWTALNVRGRWRARHLGTFGITVVAGLGAAIPHLLSPLTATLNYGVIDEGGAVDVFLTFDHRVLDGATAARILEEVERVLNGEIVTELRYFQALDAA